MPALIAQHPDAGEFNSAFAERADEITDYAAPEDGAWAFEQIDRILEEFDLWDPSHEDLPPDE